MTSLLFDYRIYEGVSNVTRYQNMLRVMLLLLITLAAFWPDASALKEITQKKNLWRKLFFFSGLPQFSDFFAILPIISKTFEYILLASFCFWLKHPRLDMLENNGGFLWYGYKVLLMETKVCKTRVKILYRIHSRKNTEERSLLWLPPKEYSWKLIIANITYFNGALAKT